MDSTTNATEKRGMFSKFYRKEKDAHIARRIVLPTTTKFKLLTHDSKAPVRATSGSAGFDIYSVEYAEVWPGRSAVLKTGVAVVIPDGFCGVIKPRSGMSVKYDQSILAGLIDSDYRGEIKVALMNHGEKMMEIKPGDRIAQLVIIPYLGESEVVEEIDETERGSGGFGSTGV